MFEAHFKQSMYLEAPIFLTFCADFYRMRTWLEACGADNNFDNFMSFMIAAIDATLASQNAALAAESLNLGICYMGTTLASATELGKVLELPENVVPIVGFALGHPSENPSVRDRLPIDGIIHYEKYKELTPQEVIKLYENKSKEGLKRYTENEKFSRLMKERGITNLAQVYTSLKYTEESHLGYSRSLKNYLERQKFL
jgi:hypothetical protein